MPMFEYHCDNCHYRFDKMVQRWDAQVKCPLCESQVHKLMSTFAIGSSQKTAVNLPPGLQPKMCTNC
jgi:putative FmdB family regulatory protein